jgi:hypothetical protein
VGSYRRAAWCALSQAGVIVGEGAVSADEDGLARLVIDRGGDVRAVVELMSGAIWVRDTLAAAGWTGRPDRARARSATSRRWRASPIQNESVKAIRGDVSPRVDRG